MTPYNKYYCLASIKTRCDAVNGSNERILPDIENGNNSFS